MRHSLSISEMPSHSHTVNSFTDRENGDDSSSSAQEVKGAGLKNTSSIGGGQAHNNMPPFYVINYYMKVKSNFETALSGICSGQTYTAYNQINISVPELVDGQTYVYNDSTSSSKKYTRAITIKCSNGTLSHTIGNPQCTSSDYSYDYYLDSCGAKCTYTYSPSYMMSTSCSVYSSNSSTTYHGYTVSATASTCTCQ
ncbi:MAG: hypothetical protein LBG59_00815 [Candidatus Peribacteria bacterium]|nr:hypothetical protein [Candidatus Peribacteria bacterium]